MAATYAWVIFSSDGAAVTDLRQLALFPQKEGGKVAYAARQATGSWYYYDDIGILTIEVSANPSKQWWRRHGLKAIATGVFRLLPPDSEIYKDDTLWSKGSVVHFNHVPVMMQRLATPNAA